MDLSGKFCCQFEYGYVYIGTDYFDNDGYDLQV
jgi:hypothetical protein